MEDTRKLTQLLVFLTVVLCGERVPVLSHRAKRTLFTEPAKDVPGPEKNYTGVRVSGDSVLVVYHHEQTVGVVEMGRDRELLNCELLEVRTKRDRVATLGLLKPLIPTQVRIPFSDMNDLMQRCQFLGSDNYQKDQLINKRARQAIVSEPRGLVSVFRGVFPDTKWCGAGDLAATYYDIGPDIELDKCCRTHDLCPVKVAGLRTQYNLTNYSPYTRSHCDCDDIFHRCLKRVGTNLSDILGNIYFNIARPVCVEDVFDSVTHKVVRRQFSRRGKPY